MIDVSFSKRRSLLGNNQVDVAISERSSQERRSSRLESRKSRRGCQRFFRPGCATGRGVRASAASASLFFSTRGVSFLFLKIFFFALLFQCCFKVGAIPFLHMKNDDVV